MITRKHEQQFHFCAVVFYVKVNESDKQRRLDEKDICKKIDI